jgi:hypothetical protein
MQELPGQSGVDINDLNPGGRYEKGYKLFNDARCGLWC